MFVRSLLSVSALVGITMAFQPARAFNQQPAIDLLSEPAQYSCTLIHGGADFEKRFMVEDTGRSAHGGEPIEIVNEPNTYYVTVSKKWLGVTWNRGGQVVASAVNLQTDSSAERILMVYDPGENAVDAVSLNCSRQEEE